MVIERIYIDTCSPNRLSDDHTQPRIRREAEAMVNIFDLIAAGKLLWSASSVLRFEIMRNPESIRQLGALKLLSKASEIVRPSHGSLHRASVLASDGLSPLDALHLAVAEQSGVSWLLTTDDRFRKQVPSSKVFGVGGADLAGTAVATGVFAGAGSCEKADSPIPNIKINGHTTSLFIIGRLLAQRFKRIALPYPLTSAETRMSPPDDTSGIAAGSISASNRYVGKETSCSNIRKCAGQFSSRLCFWQAL